MPEFESLLTPSAVLLYGRVIEDLQIKKHPLPKPKASELERLPRGGANKFLERQLEAEDAKLARIYGFSYEGHYYDLPKPAVFLVHGDGDDPEKPRPGKGQERLARAPGAADRTGVAKAHQFSGEIKVWAYDKGDFSLRLDIETGPFEQILLEAALRSENLRAAYSGADLRVSGADLRVSGADLRVRRNRGD